MTTNQAGVRLDVALREGIEKFRVDMERTSPEKVSFSTAVRILLRAALPVRYLRDDRKKAPRRRKK